MATQIETVAVIGSVGGEVFAKSQNGSLRRVSEGDPLFQGDIVITANGSSAQIIPLNGPAFVVAEQQTVTLDGTVVAASEEVIDPSTSMVSMEGVAEAARVVANLPQNSQLDINALLDEEAAAAGLSGGDGADGGSSFVDLARIVEVVSSTSYDFPVNLVASSPSVDPDPSDNLNNTPVATGDAYETDEDVALVIPAAGVLVNDVDVDGDALSAILVSGPAHGSLTLNADGSFTYTPDANYHGEDSFSYRANDGSAASNVATVSLVVNPVNDPPVATGDAYETDEDVALVIPAAGVLANDVDVDGDALSTILVSGPAHGSLTLNADGSFTYTPDANYHGEDSFSYRANDGSAASNVATVSLVVNPVNDPPVLGGGVVFLSEEGLIGGNPDEAGVPSDTSNEKIAVGQLDVSDSDSDFLTITLEPPTSVLHSHGLTVQWGGDDSGHVLVGKTVEGDVVRVEISDDGRYSVLLKGPLDHADAGEDVLTFSVGVNASDGRSVTSSVLSVTVEDDSPVVNVTPGIILDAGGAVVYGQLVNFGGDGAVQEPVWSSVQTKLDGVESGFTSQGEAVIFTLNGAEMTGKTPDGDTVLKLQAGLDGSYTMQMLRPIDTSKLFATDGALLGFGDGPKSGYFLYKDGIDPLVGYDGAADPQAGRDLLAVVTGTDSKGNSADMNISTSGLGVGGNNQIAKNELIRFDIAPDEVVSAMRFHIFSEKGSTIGYRILYTDGTVSGDYAAVTPDNAGNILLQSASGKVIDAVELKNLAGNMFKVDGVNMFLVESNKSPQLEIGFSAQDADHDATAGVLKIALDTNNPIFGTLGQDALGGGTGPDTLQGSAGNDVLTGGLGADIFVWKMSDVPVGSTVDRVTDFGTTDVLDLRDLVDQGGVIEIAGHTVTATVVDSAGVHVQAVDVTFEVGVDPLKALLNDSGMVKIG